MRISLTVIIILFTLVCTSAFGLGGPENVLVVQNGNSPISQRICAHYVLGRRIPSGNVVTISCIDSSISSANESISPGNYTTLIEEPIRSFLAANNLTYQIQYIVLTKGIPIKLTIDVMGGIYGPQSVDSMLAAMDLTAPIIIDVTNEQQQVVATVYANQYWWSYSPFRHEDRGGYLVTRLDGYTEVEAKS
ncbi:MAG: hypothetical protein NT018_08060, partial [Armatimonadetes bacterium]|nr:hypothetical protein [Armatimonadota bacterium]